MYPKFEVISLPMLYVNRSSLVDMRPNGNKIRWMMRQGTKELPGLRLYWSAK